MAYTIPPATMKLNKGERYQVTFFPPPFAPCLLPANRTINAVLIDKGKHFIVLENQYGQKVKFRFKQIQNIKS